MSKSGEILKRLDEEPRALTRGIFLFSQSRVRLTPKKLHPSCRRQGVLRSNNKAASYFPYQWNGLRWSLGAITAVFLTWEIGSNIDQITPFINNQLNPSPVATNYTQVSPDYQPVPRPGYVTGSRQNGMSGGSKSCT